MLANGDTIDDLLAEYPSLSREDILACASTTPLTWPRSKSRPIPLSATKRWGSSPDENIPRMIVDRLELPHDAQGIRGTQQQGMEDLDLWAAALAGSRVLITTDRGFTAFRTI
jgi:hypothetical protein